MDSTAITDAGSWADLDDEALADHVRRWLEAHLPAGWLDAVDGGDDERLDRMRRQLDEQSFLAELGEAGLNTPTWPPEHCGLGLRPDRGEVVERALVRYRVPRRIDFIGRSLAGATILQWGTPEQKDRFLYGLATGRDFWCQLFSEPGSGSDLASLATRAVPDGGAWVVNGQKVWSSGAHLADYGLLLARTDPEAPKHRGITYFIADMTAPGVDARPVKQMTGRAEFNEVFLTDVVIPDEMRLGPVNEGWRVSTTTLMHERSGLSTAQGTHEVDRIVDEARTTGRWSDRTVRDRLVRLLIDERILEMTAMRTTAAAETGRAPGPEASVMKLHQSILAQRAAEAAIDVRGLAAVAPAEALAADTEPYDMVSAGGRRPDAVLQYLFLFSRAQTILGGTSEIQRNIIGERVLGLPKDADPWKDQPWNGIPRS